MTKIHPASMYNFILNNRDLFPEYYGYSDSDILKKCWQDYQKVYQNGKIWHSKRFKQVKDILALGLLASVLLGLSWIVSDFGMLIVLINTMVIIGINPMERINQNVLHCKQK